MSIAALLLAIIVATQAQPQSRRDASISVYAAIPQSADGFIDPYDKRADSLKDIQNRIGKTKGLRLATAPADADIVLILDSRTVESERSGAVAAPVGNTVVSRPTYRNWLTLHTTMTMGDYRRPFQAGAGYTWGDAARFLVNDLGAWVRANYQQIIARRQ